MAIVGCRHKGSERCFSRGTTAGILSQHAKRRRLVLGRLSVATQPRDMGLPGLGLHSLKGDRHGRWAVRISGNWRISFRFDGPDVTDVNYEDYHL
jgi:proteic killer suppression protein